MRSTAAKLVVGFFAGFMLVFIWSNEKEARFREYHADAMAQSRLDCLSITARLIEGTFITEGK